MGFYHFNQLQKHQVSSSRFHWYNPRTNGHAMELSYSAVLLLPSLRRRYNARLRQTSVDSGAFSDDSMSTVSSCRSKKYTAQPISARQLRDFATCWSNQPAMLSFVKNVAEARTQSNIESLHADYLEIVMYGVGSDSSRWVVKERRAGAYVYAQRAHGIGLNPRVGMSPKRKRRGKSTCYNQIVVGANGKITAVTMKS